MAFTQSAIFQAWTRDALLRTTSFVGDLDADTFQAALYNNSITPDNTVTSANSAYNAGAWTTTNEVTDSTNWTAGGRALTGVTASATGLNYLMFDASDTAGAGNVTLASVYGDLLYDFTLATPVAKQGLAFHYFGGSQGVTAGTFTIVWHSNGVARWTHTPA